MEDNNKWEATGRQEIFTEITQRTAAKIRAAHQRGDDLRKCVEFVEAEVRDGATLMTAIATSHAVFPDVDLQRELTDILQSVARRTH